MCPLAAAILCRRAVDGRPHTVFAQRLIPGTQRDSLHVLDGLIANQTGIQPEMLDAVLARWKAAVDAHQPEHVAALFTTDAIFQGLHPYTVGRAGVAEYYAAQPMGLTAAYTLRETRALSDQLVLGYLTVDFGFSDRATLTVYLSVIIRHDADGSRIVHYQVSRLD